MVEADHADAHIAGLPILTSKGARTPTIAPVRIGPQRDVRNLETDDI
jgi:hypothetical protein